MIKRMLASNFRKLYFLTKTHNRLSNVPDRPVISNCGTPTKKASEFLDYHLKPVMRRSWSYVKDSGDFIEKIKRISNIPDDAILVTADVVALYPSIPHELGLKALENLCRGILIGVRENIKNISLELTQENKVGQSLWILLTNTKKKIRIGVIYAPQENVTPNNELKLTYEDIREQIKIGKEEKQQILIIGDFNAKIGEAVEGSKTQVTKGGRQLLKLANEENMIILNTVKEKCKGVWTRVQGEEKSIIDYVLTDASSANTVKKMKIDEEKQYGLQKLYKNTATNE